MFASGVPTAEKPQAKKYFLLTHGAQSRGEQSSAWDNYKKYLHETSILIPIPPAIYRPLPQFVKTWFLFDLPQYQFREETDGREALAEQLKEERRDN